MSTLCATEIAPALSILNTNLKMNTHLKILALTEDIILGVGFRFFARKNIVLTDTFLVFRQGFVFWTCKYAFILLHVKSSSTSVTTFRELRAIRELATYKYKRPL